MRQYLIEIDKNLGEFCSFSDFMVWEEKIFGAGPKESDRVLWGL